MMFSCMIWDLSVLESQEVSVPLSELNLEKPAHGVRAGGAGMVCKRWAREKLHKLLKELLFPPYGKTGSTFQHRTGETGLWGIVATISLPAEYK